MNEHNQEAKVIVTNGEHRIELYRDAVISNDMNSKTLDLCCFDIFRHMNTCGACAALVNKTIGRGNKQEEPWYIFIDEECSMLDLDRYCGRIFDEDMNTIQYRIGPRRDSHGDMLMRLHLKKYDVDLAEEIVLAEKEEHYLVCAFFKNKLERQ